MKTEKVKLLWWQEQIDMHETYMDLEWIPACDWVPPMTYPDDEIGPVCEQLWAIQEKLA